MRKLTMHDRPFDGRLKEVCIRKEGSSLRMIAIPNPDYIPINMREGDGLHRPRAKSGYKSLSDIEYKKILIDYGVTENPPDTFGMVGYNSSTNAGNKNDKNTSRKGIASGATVLVAGQLTSASESNPTPIMIYAKQIYGIEYNDFSDEKLKTKAKIDLGINDESKLIPKHERLKNFEYFKEKHFSNIDNLAAYSGNEPEPHMAAYKEIEKYALSAYGSLMIKNVLSNNQTPNFIIGVSDNPGTKAHGQYDNNFIVLPANFPSAKYFAVSKQQVLGVAIIHHEFEHTKHGKFKNIDLGRGVLEEWRAVRYNENPVRIISGVEPRYVYYSNEAGKTINILTKETKTGKWTYNKSDPSKPMIKAK